MIYYKNWLFFMQISRFVYLKTKLKLVLCQKIRSIIHRIGVQSFILLSQSAQYFCLTAILILYQLANRHLLKSQTSFKLFDWFLVIK